MGPEIIAVRSPVKRPGRAQSTPPTERKGKGIAFCLSISRNLKNQREK